MVTLTNGWSVDDAHVIEALRDADMQDARLIYEGSNYVFLTTLRHPEHGEGLGVYKPAAGEQPLMDFPGGTLYRREVAAYEFARLLGWHIVPPTVAREGPQGVGSLQLFVEHSPAQHYFSFREEPALAQQLIRIAAFDLMMNNADRKGGHLLLDAQERLWCIDNALCFHHHFKLRTVIWDFAGTELPEQWVADIKRVGGCLAAGEEAAEALKSCLTEPELAALISRCEELAATPVLPEMFPYRCTPWPLI